MAGAIAEAFVRIRAEYDTASFKKGTDQVVKGNQQLSRSLKDGERDFGRFARGAAVGSGAVHGLGRSIAFASASFLGAYGFVSVLRTSIETAEHFEKASRGLDAQLKTLGISSTSAAPLIAKTNAQMANLGITADQSEEALGRLIRATGNVSRATKLMGLTADLAAARHIGLSQAALIVGKVVQGTTTAFNRFGIVIKAGTSVTDALTIAQKKLAGQAEANVTPLEKLHAGVTNLEAAIGTQLLPTVNKIADSLNKWLANSANQERIQRDVSRAVKDGTAIISGFAQALRLANGILENTIGKVLSLKHAVELLVLVMVVKKIDTFAASLGLVGTSAAAATAPVAVLGTTAATTATEMAVLSKSIGTGAAGQLAFTSNAASGAAAATRMGTALRVGIAAGAIVAGVELSRLIRKIPGWESTFRHFGGFLQGIFGGGSGQGPTAPPGLEAALRARVARDLAQGGGDFAAFGNPLALAGFDVTQPTGPPGAEASSITGLKGQDAAKRAALVTREQATATALARAQAEGTRAQITAATNARLAYIKDTIAFARRLISQGRGDTKQLESTLQSLYGEQGSDLGILSGFSQDDANAAAKRAATAKAKSDKAAAAAAKQAAVVKANAEKVLRAVKAANKLRADQLNATLAAGRAYTYSFVTGLGAIGAANRKAAAAKAARVAGRAADASEATLLGLQNTLAEDDLITNPAKRLAKQKKDEENLVLYYQRIVHTLEKQKKGILAINQAKANVISAQVALHSLSTSTAAAGGGFTLQQLFAEAGSELQQYGSNVGTDLSPQDARASFAGIVKSNQTTVHQHFYGSRPTGQALADARAVARNSK